MRALILVLFFLSQSGFCQFSGLQKFFIKKGDELVFFDGQKLTTVTSGNIQLCFPFILKGTDLYNLSVNPVISLQLIARGVTKVFNNNFLVKDKLYSFVNGKVVYLTDGVTDVYNNCPDPYKPGGYRIF